jgi:hypothetical protein
MIRTTLDGIETAGNIEFLFLKLVYNSLFNDYLAKCIKVFENSKQSASFFYIYKNDEKAIKVAATIEKIDLNIFDNIAPKLKGLRDSLHFHLDRDGIMDTNQVWHDAEITVQELKHCVLSAQKLLSNLATTFNLKKETIPNEYNTTIPYRIAKVINSGQW